MDHLQHTADELRRMSAAELAGMGEDSLKARLFEQGAEAHAKFGKLSAGNLETFLSDPDCVRYPTRLILEYGEMGMHQFAHPDVDLRDASGRGRVIYIRPVLGKRPDLLALAVSYVVPVINYGDIIGDDHCQIYGASLMGLSEQAYFDAICELADFVGAEECFVDGEMDVSPGCGQGGGCGCKASE